MVRVVEVDGDDKRERFRALAGFPLDARAVERQRAEQSWLVENAAGKPVGRCSLWWTGTPPHEGHRLGYIGHFAVTDLEAATPLLDHACKRLAERGCTLAVGPIDGNTWQRYRFITERGDEPLFFLEPDNPDDWPSLWTAAGFTPLATYTSALNTDLAHEEPRLSGVAQRLAERGIVFHTLDPARYEQELKRVYQLSLASFANNFLYTPLGEAEFAEQYAAVRPYIRPELFVLAEKGDDLIGYFFCLPDLLQAKRGVPIDTVLLKTMAVHPAHGGMGVGGVLMAKAHAAARDAGFRRAIHVLMHETNRSGKISGHTARVFRRYTLFARPVGGRP